MSLNTDSLPAAAEPTATRSRRGSSLEQERTGQDDEAGVVRICGMRTLPSHRQLALAFVILASTAYFAVEVRA
jgi:hypothetical protein